LLFLLLLGLAATAPAGRAGEVSPERAKGLPVAGFKLEGVDGMLGRDLAQGLAYSGESKLLSTRYPLFYPETLQEDVLRTRLFLARGGYPHAEVTPVLLEENRRIRIRLEVKPGDPVRFGGLGFTGFPPRPEPAKLVEVREGDVFTEAGLDEGTRVLRRSLEREGHARARVEREVVARDPSTVDVTWNATPGPVYHFGDLTVEGLAPDLAGLVQRTLAIDRGDRYSSRTLEQARDDLRAQGLYRQVRIRTVESAGDTLDVEADLAPAAPRYTELGVGFWTDDLIRVHAAWTHRNLFRGGRGFRVEGAYSAYERSASASTWWPALLGPRTRVQLRVGGKYEVEDAYNQLSLGGDLSALYRLSVRSFVQAGLEVTANTVEEKTDDPVFLEQPGRLSVLYGELYTDGSDDQFWPTRGMRNRLRLEVTTPSFSENEYVGGAASHAQYRTILPRVVLAGRIQVGAAQPLGESIDLLPSKRFFAGGATSHRAFQRRRLGPKTSEGDPVGGEAIIEFSTEVRFPLFWVLESALFVDVGQVWERWENVNLRDLKVGVGPSLMLRSPVGPIRFDVGLRLSEVDTDEPEVVWHLLVGNPY
jgi:outer membrane protein assembly factor BamA